MADVHTIETRSYNMSKIRSKNTMPEIAVRRFLFANGYRFRIHDKNLPGNPDIVLKKYNTVIFIHGCFWHMHKGCKFSSVPSTNKEYWIPKLVKNVEKDKTAAKALRKLGWKVITLWECKLQKREVENTLDKLIKELHV